MCTIFAYCDSLAYSGWALRVCPAASEAASLENLRIFYLMKIWINGLEKEVERDYLLATLLNDLEVQGRFAIEINGEIIPRTSFQSRIILENDKGDHEYKCSL